MLKVIIADDEKNICMLIQKLIDWKSLGMEVVAVAHNAVSAFDYIEMYKPDIVITDIRMPGYDGIELIRKMKNQGMDSSFIVISGYKYFEYAHDALKLGVKHYLLKPIDKDELGRALEQLLEEKKSVIEQRAKEEALENTVRMTRKRIKEHFLTSIINNQIDTSMPIEEINQNYQCDFKQGVFQASFLKVDSENADDDEMKHMLDMMNTHLEDILSSRQKEFINSVTNSGIVTIINSETSDMQQLEDEYSEMFAIIKHQIEKFRDYHVTWGIGMPVDSIENTKRSIQSAIDGVKCRSRIGMDRVIYMYKTQFRPVDIAQFFEESDRRGIKNIVEALDYKTFHEKIDKNIELIHKVPFYTPIAVYDYFNGTTEVIEETLITLKLSETSIEKFIHELHRILDQTVAEHMIIEKYKKALECFMLQVMGEKKQQGQLPLRLAKAYVAEHYMEQISLEDVGNAINMSTSYLSTMFKKEIGVNFSEYLMNCRIEAAKKILKENPDVSIAEVAECVGYNDSRYFSKIFNKIIGLKPSTYRKLYS